MQQQDELDQQHETYKQGQPTPYIQISIETRKNKLRALKTYLENQIKDKDQKLKVWHPHKNTLIT